MKADDGYYYMYQTDASYGNAHSGNGHFHARRSKDLVNWEYLGATMSETPPTWIKEKLNAYRQEMGLEPIDNPSYGYWAPVARQVSNGKYRMYYSIVITNYIQTGKPEIENNGNFDGSWTERAFIGLMETSDPASNIWEDKGFVVCSASDRPYLYNNGKWRTLADLWFMAQRYRCPTGKSGRRQTAECFGKSLGHHRGRQFGLWKDNRHTWHQPLAGIRRSRSDLS